MTLQLIISTAFASSGETEDFSMGTMLWGLALVGFVYLTAHFVVDRLQRRYLFSSGAEYIALGMGLSYLAVFRNSSTYLPAITFAIGWIGLMFGMNLPLRQLFQNGAVMRLALTEFIFVGLGMTALHSALLYSFVEADLSISLTCGGVLGAASLATSSSAIAVIRQRFPSLKAHLLTSLEQGSKINNGFAIVLCSIFLCMHQRQQIFSSFYEHAPLQGGGIILLCTILFGLLLATIYSFFLIENDSENSRFLAITGIVCFAAGGAFYMQSPVLLLMMSLGYGLSKTKHKDNIVPMMEGSKKPILLILLILAGVQIQNVSFGITSLLFLAFIISRFLLKALSSWLSSYGSSIRGDLFRGNLAQGEISLSIALSFYVIDGQIADTAYVIAIASVAVHEIISARWLRDLLIDIGEIRDDISIIQEG